MSEEPKKGRGGYRPGAGRKPAHKEPMVVYAIRVPQRTKDKAKRIGDQAVRDAIDAAPEPQEPSKE